jgi:hypothetical protein
MHASVGWVPNLHAAEMCRDEVHDEFRDGDGWLSW